MPETKQDPLTITTEVVVQQDECSGEFSVSIMFGGFKTLEQAGQSALVFAGLDWQSCANPKSPD